MWCALLLAASLSYLCIAGMVAQIAYFFLLRCIAPKRRDRSFYRSNPKRCCFALLLSNHTLQPLLTHHMSPSLSHPRVMTQRTSTAGGFSIRPTLLKPGLGFTNDAIGEFTFRAIPCCSYHCQLNSNKLARLQPLPCLSTCQPLNSPYVALLMGGLSSLLNEWQVIPTCWAAVRHQLSDDTCSCRSLSFTATFLMGRRSVQPLRFIPCTQADVNMFRFRALCYLFSSSFFPHLVLFSPFSPCLGFPGEGPFSVASTNVTSLPKNRYSILSLGQYLVTESPVEVICMQETRIPTYEMSSLQADCQEAGWQLILGYQPGVSVVHSASPDGPKAFRQRQGGLATMVSDNQHVHEILYPENWKLLYEFCLMTWVALDSSSGCVLANCYLPSHAVHREKRSQIMESLLEYIATFAAPVCLCGDFQDPPGENTAITDAIIHGGFEDVIALKDSVTGNPPKFTFPFQAGIIQRTPRANRGLISSWFPLSSSP